MKKADIVNGVLKDRVDSFPDVHTATAFAPTNIALCKYWGKRNQELNLPVTSSLSISLSDKGAKTTLSVSENKFDRVVLNGKQVPADTAFHKRLIQFLTLFRPHPEFYFDVETISNIPIAAGLASSACGFASIVLAMDRLFSWQLHPYQLSILARLGSGSASRSIWQGFVEWHAGERLDGMDSHGEVLATTWPELSVGLLMLSQKEKAIGSREAMQRTVATSELYRAWPDKVAKDLCLIKDAIARKEFDSLGQAAESNALAMHATMLSAWPPIHYALPETISAMHKVWQLRQDGLPVYFTQDAGPNLKLLFMAKHSDQVRQVFPQIDVIMPWG